jgi:quinohemoprotein ethanol dehydrogenase
LDAPTGADFPTLGGNLANQRYSSLTEINAASLSSPGGSWLVHIAGPSGAGSMEVTPVVENGVMYIPNGSGGVLALTGETHWTESLLCTTLGTVRNCGPFKPARALMRRR